MKNAQLALLAASAWMLAAANPDRYSLTVETETDGVSNIRIFKNKKIAAIVEMRPAGTPDRTGHYHVTSGRLPQEAMLSEYFPNGKLRARWLASFETDKKWLCRKKVFHPNGKISISMAGKGCRGRQKIRLFHPSGRLLQEFYLLNGLTEGIQKSYGEDGSLEMTVPHRQGLREGTAKIYFPNGTVQGEFTFSNDKKNGVSRSYHEDGTVEGEALYVNDVLQKK